MKVIVHPGCKWEVVQKADMAGSTAYIVEQVRQAPPGTERAIGTEVHLVNRLKHEHPEQKIVVLSDCQCLCTTMYRIDLPHLCWIFESLVAGKERNEIKVDANTREWSLVALERMLAIKGTGNPIGKQQPASAKVDWPHDLADRPLSGDRVTSPNTITLFSSLDWPGNDTNARRCSGIVVDGPGLKDPSYACR